MSEKESGFKEGQKPMDVRVNTSQLPPIVIDDKTLYAALAVANTEVQAALLRLSEERRNADIHLRKTGS